MKQYPLIVSNRFQSTHPRKGQSTDFVLKILNNFNDEMLKQLIAKNDFIAPDTCFEFARLLKPKLHTIRTNYPLWEKRIKEVQAGKAELSLRYWVGRPYHTNQHTFLTLGKDSGIGIQPLHDYFAYACIDAKKIDWHIVAQNDGLSFEDFCHWFNKISSEPLAIIHFTDFRY